MTEIEQKCTNCKHNVHCDETSRLYGIPKWNGGCIYYKEKEKDKCHISQ